MRRDPAKRHGVNHPFASDLPKTQTNVDVHRSESFRLHRSFEGMVSSLSCGLSSTGMSIEENGQPSALLRGRSTGSVSAHAHVSK